MEVIKPSVQRVLEIYRTINTKNGQKTKYCAEVKKELGITFADIQAIKLVNVPLNADEAGLWKRKTIKALVQKLREYLFESAIEKKILTIGQPLPKIGFWNSGKIVSGLSIDKKIILLCRVKKRPSMTLFQTKRFS